MTQLNSEDSENLINLEHKARNLSRQTIELILQLQKKKSNNAINNK